jgi:D-arabinose 1-dehydrogenase-like Zn-dependent alcohol dehydrogenase
MPTTTSEMTMRAAQVQKAGDGMKMLSISKKVPEGHDVRIKVAACGVCHSDSFALDGHYPGLKYPVVPGHEIVGIVDAVGPEVTRFKKGDRVGVGWHGGHCEECVSCRKGDFVTCDQLQTPGITCDGGYAEYTMFPDKVCAAVPESLDSCEAAPLLCAGVTTFNALRHAGAFSGDLVAVLGIGGLGHLGVQFANKMGFKTIAIARGVDKRDLAMQLGAHQYIDSQTEDAASVLKKLGGAKVILCTVTSSPAMSPLVEGLGVDGKMVIVGAGFEPLAIAPVQLLGARRSIVGWPSGTGRDSEECMQFCAASGIRPMIERFPFKDVEAAYQRMISGKARFRAVLEF